MGLKWEPFAARGQSLTVILCFPPFRQTSGVSHNGLYCSSGCLISIFHLIGCVPIQSTVAKEWHRCCVSKEEINSTVPKTLQIFSHGGEQRRPPRSLPSPPTWVPEPQWTCNVIYSGNQGWSSPVLMAHLPLGSHRCQETIFFFFSHRRATPPWKRFNNKQTRGRGHLNHGEKNPSGFDRLTNERHVMLILHFTLQTITQTTGGHFLHTDWH